MLVAKAVSSPDLVEKDILSCFKAAASNRYSWRLRFAVAETAALLSPHVTRAAVDETIMNIYELLMRDSEPEVRSEAVA